MTNNSIHMPVIDCQPIHQIEGCSSYKRQTLTLVNVQQLVHVHNNTHNMHTHANALDLLMRKHALFLNSHSN